MPAAAASQRLLVLGGSSQPENASGVARLLTTALLIKPLHAPASGLPLACTRSSAFMALSGSGPHVVLERRVPKPHHNGVPARDHCHDLAVVAGRRQWCRGEGPASAQRGRINPAKMLSPECRISNSELTSGPSRLTPVPAETSPNGSEWVSVPVSSPTRGGRAHDSTLCAMVSPHDQR
jgi:hypothetical protein